MKRNQAHDNDDLEFDSTKKQKLNSQNSFNLLVREYDSYVLRYVFTFCSVQDLPSLAVVCKEWYEDYFSRNKIKILLKEWIDIRWNKICQQNKTPWDWCVEDEHLVYWPRLINAFTNDKHVDEDKNDYLIDYVESDKNGEETDEINDQQSEEKLEGEIKTISDNVECFELGSVKICKITTDPNQFILISQKHGNIILFRKAHGLSCLFYGSRSYPSLEHCNYRSDFWVKLIPNEKGIFMLQMLQITEYLGLTKNDYSNVCSIINFIGFNNVKVSKAIHLDPWDNGEFDGMIEYFPWEINHFLGRTLAAATVFNQDMSGAYFCKIVDHRFFSDFKLFCKLVRRIKLVARENKLEKNLLENLCTRVDGQFLKNRGMLDCLKDKKVFKFLDVSLRHDREFIVEALKINVSILKYLFNEEYHDIITIDRALIIEYLKDGNSLLKLPDTIDIDRELIQTSIKGGCTLEEIPEKCRNLDTIIQILKRNPSADLRSVSKLLSSNIDYALEVVKYSPEALVWIEQQFKKLHPEIERTAVKFSFTAYYYCINRNQSSDLKQLANQSLVELLEKPGKKIKIVYAFEGETKEKKVIEITDKKLQTIFLLNESMYLDIRQYYGPHIDEKGHYAKLYLYEDDDEISTLQEELLTDRLVSLSKKWQQDVRPCFHEIVNQFLNPLDPCVDSQ